MIKNMATKATAKMKKPANTNSFKKGDHVSYPAHGVGKIEGVETQTIAGMDIKLYVIAFEKDRMRLKLPTMKAEALSLIHI